MADLLWPGDERAAEVFTDAALLDAMVAVEQAWLDALAGAGIAESTPLAGIVGATDLDRIATGAEAGGNPVIGLVALLRERTGSRWVHRGLTSQDVLDTALVLCLDDAVVRVREGLRQQAAALVRLARVHRGTLMAGRTLTQHAVPITFGLKAATWLQGAAAGADRLARCPSLPAQLGGAAGTLAAPTQLAGSVEAAQAVVADASARLGLAVAAPWHTERSVLTEHADALVGCADAWGRIAADVALLSRPEIGELREAAGGGSSTMPGKANPVLSVLLRRHALAAPALAATLHTAASAYVDERPDGAWHAEWDTLRTLARRSVVAASQAADLLEGLVVDASRMAARAAEADETLRAEQVSMGGGDAPYLGATDRIIDLALDRARTVWKDL
ncbi:3-carboxy-cis,cis-muconate cycloisomerase [Nocardioides panacihumi]|uniref:3-carboxy-cis,cis-muconate cycloisomerase n=1 Tax=Nocardioides panacihumi TaxID=400774 RepID=A0ABN2QKY2_9ACTN